MPRDDITFTSFSRYFRKRSNRESEIIEVAFTLIAFGSSSTTFLFESFLRWARNLASWRKNVSTTRFSLNNLLRLLHFPFYGFSWCRICQRSHRMSQNILLMSCLFVYFKENLGLVKTQLMSQLNQLQAFRGFWYRCEIEDI